MMVFDNDRSDIWNSVIKALGNGGATADEIVEQTETNIYVVRRVLREMEDLGWVNCPVDNDGTFERGETAREVLR